MKISELTNEVICQHCKLIFEDMEPAEITLLHAQKDAAVRYCENYTGLSAVELDECEDVTIAVLVIISDMVDNANMCISGKVTANKIIETILGMHSRNLIPSAPDEVEL